MIIVTVALAIIALMLDAYTTRAGLKEGRMEGNRVRLFLIRLLGINGGTYGFAAAASATVIAVNVLSRQPKWGLAIGNLLIALICSYAAERNWRSR
jgi:hypothetical protein